MTTTDHIVIPLPFVLGRSEREAVTSPVAKAGKSQRSGRPTCCLSNQKRRVEQWHFSLRRMVNGGFDFFCCGTCFRRVGLIEGQLLTRFCILLGQMGTTY